MSVQLCTSDRYAVGMFSKDVCIHYMECAVSLFGKQFLQETCGYFTEDYTDQLYNGTDSFTYYVDENDRTATGNGNPLFNTFTCYIIIFAFFSHFMA